MPGLHVTDTQVRLYMSKRTQRTQAAAAESAAKTVPGVKSVANNLGRALLSGVPL